MPATLKPPKPHKRNGYWYYIRAIPKEFAQIDDRKLVMLTTGIRVSDDPRGTAATPAVARLDAATFEYWNAMRAGHDPKTALRWKTAIDTLRRQGFESHPFKTLTAQGAEQLLKRLEALASSNKLRDEIHAAAMLGTRSEPGHKVDNLLVAYEDIQATQHAKKSPRQMERWRGVRKLALNAFMEIVGKDRTVESLTRKDVLEFRADLQKRVLAKDIGIDSANKYITRVGAMYRAFNQHQQLNLPDIFEKVGFGPPPENQRNAYTPEFIQKRILAEGALADLNDEARRIIYLMVETGVRPSEAVNLNSSTIVLDHEVPHIRIIEDGRQVKSKKAIREIPLVGVALKAMKLQPNGFPRYHDKADYLSAAVNKFLKSKDLRPEKGQSLYSLRHSFKDRLRDINTSDELKDMLMGHENDAPDYGKGFTLTFKQRWLKKMVFQEPSKL